MTASRRCHRSSPHVPIRAARWLLLMVGLTACGTPPAIPIDLPPLPGAVREGQAEDIDSQDVRSSLFANWDPFQDPEGSPLVYEWSIGTRAGEADVLDWTSVGGSTRAVATSLNLPIGTNLIVSVRASDVRGNRSQSGHSDGIRIAAGADASGTGSARPDGLPSAAGGPPAGGTSAAGTPTTGTAATGTAATGIPATAPTPTQPPTGGATTTAPTAEPAGAVSAIDRAGIVWTFARPATTGRFANGDFWVLGPVEIVAIQPPSQPDGARVKHGSMINPDPKLATQGYDSAMFGDGAAGRYDPSSNKALGVSRDRPLQLRPGQSLVSTISQGQAGAVPQLETCAVLTCLDTAPPPDAFRPPYVGTDKTCRWRASQIDTSRLLSLEPVAGAPKLAPLAERFQRTWLDHMPGWTGRYLHPRANMPDYGRDLADLVGQAGLALQLKGPANERQALSIQLVQLGIDIHGLVQNGGRFAPDGGSGSGRKFPLLFAAVMLQDETLMATLRNNPMAFGEDAQTFYVQETSPGVWNNGHGGYTADDAGLPEWGNRHAEDSRFDNKSWTGDPYRRCCTANAWCGFVLAARMMGQKQAWGHDALFDYVDRYMQVEARELWTRAWNPFAERMWDQYRPQF